MHETKAIVCKLLLIVQIWLVACCLISISVFFLNYKAGKVNVEVITSVVICIILVSVCYF